MRSRAGRALIAAKDIQGHQSSYLNESRVYMSSKVDDYPIVIDLGASTSLSLNLRDFVRPPRPCDQKGLNGLSGSTSVEGIGTVEWRVRDMLGNVETIRCEAYYVPKATIRLFSPQKYFQEQNGGTCELTAFHVKLHMPNGLGTLKFPFQPPSNLPMMLPATGESQANIVNREEFTRYQKGNG